MSILTVATTPFNDQRPGTSGLRKPVTIFQQPHYLENFIQANLDTLNQANATLVLGGDGRYFNEEALHKIVQLCAANGVRKLLIGKAGQLSTPAVSHLIRHYGAAGGFILSASHNPGGPTGDFGIKFNVQNGGPAPESFTETVYRRSQVLSHYNVWNEPISLDLSRCHTGQVGDLTWEVIDSVADYAALMSRLFDFDLIRDWLKRHRLCFDAMNAITGPYAKAIFVDQLGATPNSLLRSTPLSDFGGGHPDPNPVHAADLWALMHREDGPDLGAASDGDGDRNLILGHRCYVTPSDSLAILLANAHLVPGYRTGVVGVARSMPTSRAVDGVAEHLGIPCFETPTGWKFFGNLLDHGKIGLCGEESFGTSSHHIREKDGLWAVLFWLNIVAARDQSVSEIVDAHWQRFGRVYYSRHDYEGIDSALATTSITTLRQQLPALIGKTFGDLRISWADDFAYCDPVDGSESRHQGLRLGIGHDQRIIVRLSGTGTVGATVRLYFEHIERDPNRRYLETQSVLQPLIVLAEQLLSLRQSTGKAIPDVVT